MRRRRYNRFMYAILRVRSPFVTKSKMRVLIVFTLMLSMLAVVTAAGAAELRYPGIFASADGYAWDWTKGRLVLSGGSPTLVLIDKKVTFKAAWIKIIFSEGKAGAFEVDRILLYGGSPSVVSEEQGIALEAADIAIVAPKAKGATGIESASAKGGVRLIQSKGENTVNASSDSLEVSDAGDKAVLTGKVLVDARNAARHITLAGAVATVTGLRSQAGQPSDVHLIAEGGAAPAQLDVEGVLSATAGKVDATKARVLLTGGSPLVNWGEQKTTLEAAEISVFLTESQAKDSASEVERVVLHGGLPKIASEAQGLTLTAADITVFPPKARGQGPIESAAANGGVHLVRSQGSDHLDSMSGSLEISDRGDKAVFAGGAVLNVNYPDYQGKLTGDAVTLTGLLVPSNTTANRHMLSEGNATVAMTGQIDAQAGSIDITSERAILKGGSPKATFLQSKSSVEAGVITVSFVATQGPKGQQMAVDEISLREGSPKIVSGGQGLTLTADRIDAAAPREAGGGPIQSATATGRVHLVQSQDVNTADITADVLELKDAGDTAVLTGNVVVITKSPQNSSKETGDRATITELLAKPGQTAAGPHIVLEGKPGHIHVESMVPPKPVEKPAKSVPKRKAK
jgi:lipopolysaccharide export system protein LptA